LLTHSERLNITSKIINAVKQSSHNVPIIVGTGANSTRETIQLCVESAKVGAEFVMVIPPGYYAGALDKTALKQFFLDVADGSPAPVGFNGKLTGASC
jgi:4-hydroxy-2-oxoglutarate aldolase